MAHRHTVQKRAHGGRSGFSAGGKANPFKHNFASPGGDREADEGKSRKESFKRGGVSVAKAHGGAAKKRGDKFARGGKPFEKGGSVWSEAAKGLRGKKGFAGSPTAETKNSHGEKHDDRTGDTEHKAFRHGHGGKARHQYAKGGVVVAARAKRKHGGKAEREEEGGDGEDECTAARGGRYHFKMGKMHPAHVHKGKSSKKASGGTVSDDKNDEESIKREALER